MRTRAEGGGGPAAASLTDATPSATSDDARGRRPSTPPGPAWTAFRPTPRLFRAAAWVIHRVAWRLRMLEFALAAVERELTSTVRVPWYRRPGLWRRGFLSESRVLYGLDGRRDADYVTDIERCVGTRTINGAYSVLLDDKLQFDRLMAPFPELVPRLFGVLAGREVVPAGARAGRTAPIGLAELLCREGRLALKPSSGGGGKDFTRLEAAEDGTLFENGRPLAAHELDRVAERAAGCMVTEHVDQHPDMAALYPRTANTIRLITMQDADGRPFVARAVLRIGQSRSEPTDNWIKGGLCAAVDTDTGVIGRAAPFPAYSDRMSWVETHPETDAPIAGVAVPGWPVIRRRILEVAAAVPELAYVGWDIVVTRDGLRIIEGNSYSGVNLLQIHGPLLADDRILAFFRRHGAIRR